MTFAGPGGAFDNYGTVIGGKGGDGGGGGAGTGGTGGDGGSGGVGGVSPSAGRNIGGVGGYGGNGGNGGIGGTAAVGGGGGNGVTFSGPGGAFTNHGTVTGGHGGDGGSGGIADGGPGGDGGSGVFTLRNGSGGSGGRGGAGGAGGLGGAGASFAGPGGSVDNYGAILGGAGGLGGQGGSVTDGTAGASGASGLGGVGVTGASLTIFNAGKISGGLSGDGVMRANAITFTGGVNTLTITSTSVINGRVSAFSAADTLGLGGAGNGSFDIGQIGAAGSSAQYQGFGILQKTGASTWELVGTSATKLAYAIDGGALEINGTVAASTITVNAGGTLAGTGMIGDPQINAGGTLAPGSRANPYGTLTIVGPLGFSAGSFYHVNIDPRRNSRTNVVGTTTIQGGNVNVAAGQGTYAIRTYTILNSTQGVTGTFSGLTTDTAFAFLMPSLAYDANNVYLNIAPTSAVTSVNGRRVPNYAIAASTGNQFSIASGLTQAGIQSGGRGPVLNALNQLTVPQAQRAFGSLSGEGINAAQNVAFRSAQLFTSSILDQTTFYSGGGAANSMTLTERLPGLPAFLALAPNEPAPIRELADLPASRIEPAAPQPVATRTWRAWANGYGGIENISGNRGIGSAAQRNDILGGALGVDYQLLPNYLIGIAVGGSNGNFRVDQRGTSGSTTGGHIALYDLYELGNWYGASSTAFSYFGNQTTRFTSGFGGLGTEQNRGNFDSREFRTRLEVGRHFTSLPLIGGLPALVGFGTVTPFVALEVAELRSNGFTETPLKSGPGLFRLNVSGQTAASAPGFVGLRFQKVTPLGNGMVLSPTLQVAYVHEFAPYRNQVGTRASLPGSTFLVDGARPARDAAQVKAGAELALGPHSAVFANFDGEFSGINQLYAGKGGFKYVW